MADRLRPTAYVPDPAHQVRRLAQRLGIDCCELRHRMGVLNENGYGPSAIAAIFDCHHTTVLYHLDVLRRTA